MYIVMNLDTFLEIIKKADLPDIKKLCESNKTFNAYCKENKEYIYSQLIKRDFPGRENESQERKYKRLLNYKEGKVSPLDEWYMGKDQSHKLLELETYEKPKLLNQVLQTKPDFSIRSNKDWTPLMFAIRYSTPEIIKRLLDMNANVNVKDEEGWTPLMFATRYNTPEVINRLLDMNVDVNVKDEDGSTPLMFAIRYSTPEVINRLLDMNADVTVKDEEGWTLLIVAIRYSTPEIINRLLDMNADVNVKNMHAWTRKTILDFAQEYSTPEIVTRIRSLIQEEACEVAPPVFDDIFGTIHGGKLRVNTKKDGKWRRWKCETICKEQLIQIAQGVGITDPVGSKKELCNSIQEALENTGRMR